MLEATRTWYRVFAEDAYRAYMYACSATTDQTPQFQWLKAETQAFFKTIADSINREVNRQLEKLDLAGDYLPNLPSVRATVDTSEPGICVALFTATYTTRDNLLLKVQVTATLLNEGLAKQ